MENIDVDAVAIFFTMEFKGEQHVAELGIGVKFIGDLRRVRLGHKATDFRFSCGSDGNLKFRLPPHLLTPVWLCELDETITMRLGADSRSLSNNRYVKSKLIFPQKINRKAYKNGPNDSFRMLFLNV